MSRFGLHAFVLGAAFTISCATRATTPSPTDGGPKDSSAPTTDAASQLTDAASPPVDAATTHDASPASDAATPRPEPNPFADAVESQRIAADIALIAGARSSGTTHWQAVQTHCATRLESLGFVVERINYGTGVNVVGTRQGSRVAGEHVVVSAHYDSTPNCAGADDNASGVAGVLEVARVLTSTVFDRTLVAACWDEEERGLIGSLDWTASAMAAQVDIAASVVFEMIGYRSTAPDSQSVPNGFSTLFPDAVAKVHANADRGDFIAVIADHRSAALSQSTVQAAVDLGLPVINLDVSERLLPFVSGTDPSRSDHAAFWLRGYPGLLLTDTANLRNPHYHCSGGPDAVADLDMAFATDAVRVAARVLGAVLVHGRDGPT